MSHAASPRSMLEKVLSILETVGSDGPVVTRTRIIERTRLPKATANRIVADLVTTRLLQPIDDGVALGLRLFELGSRAEHRGLGLRDAALPYMQDLYEITHATVQLAILDGTDVVYLQKISGRRSVRLDTRVGGRQPLTCTGSGKLLLAFAVPDLLEKVMCEHGLVSRTRNSLTGEAALRRELATIRKQLFAVDNEEFAIGTRSVAAGITHRQQVVAALSLSGSTDHISTPTIAPAVRAAASAISRKLATTAIDHAVTR
ncbi:IclR family transcriptional regulator [Actinopolymorpha sp. B11F2]|uniref:IclR family transcriptional regulator n=1 Tax=Actinopolymorpha sp. B11F2 TaxID=3160862 RepID=UPI0032E48EE6